MSDWFIIAGILGLSLLALCLVAILLPEDVIYWIDRLLGGDEFEDDRPWVRVWSGYDLVYEGPVTPGATGQQMRIPGGILQNGITYRWEISSRERR